ncbi:MAG: single-stranded DNA-binding protein [Flavobacteriales bacterium]|nr:single-stranded DNA-binding protein [Flavobacteriales bacterium]
MASVNKVILIGNLGKDPEIKSFENGGMIAQFTLATVDSYYDKEQGKRIELPTDWHNIVVKRSGLAKVAQQFLHKGSQVFVEGKLKTRSYQTKEGETRWITEVHVDELVLTGKGPAQTEARPAVAPPPPMPPQEGDDLPF